MKTTTPFTAAGCLICLLIMQTSFSQSGLGYRQANTTKTSLILRQSVANNANTVSISTTVNLKVQRSFIKYFTEAAEQNWSAVGSNFLNRFHMKGLLTNALFDRKGNLIYTITYGTEKDMLADIRKVVKREYYDYAIVMAVQVKETRRTIWVVQMEDTKTNLTVRIEDGEMEEVQRFNKS